VPYGIGGTIYLVAALALGAWFFVVGALGLRQKAGPTWARQLFFVSMIYLMGIFGALTAGTAFDSSDAPAARADAPASLELASNAADSQP
jgi:heme O synthase-like polyprenyltransferase